MVVGGQSGEIVPETPISKTTRTKCTRGIVQTVKHLMCKLKALSSNPSPTKILKNEISKIFE
jgi:hypothetical protein